MNSELRIRTPEGITFAYSLAGPVTRCTALAVDLFCVIVLATTLSKGLALAGLLGMDIAGAFQMLGFFVISIGYGVVMEWSCRGQTLGKRLLRLRVMDAGGLRLRFHQVLMRNLLRAVDMLPAFYLLGGVVSLLSPRAQRLGDLAAGTIVIHQPRHRQPDLDQLLAGKFNSLREHPHLAARLRQRATAEEARLVLQALVRRDEFEPAARVILFSELAEHFKTLVTFPAEVTDSMPDEQFIRNVVDVLFRQGTATGASAKNELKNLFDTPNPVDTLPARFSDLRETNNA
ncbi:MAG: domain containing protein [Chthoniobacteraceae bacterium]|nr:domain containing protein [Chthoniobacteraceae bacterium]